MKVIDLAPDRRDAAVSVLAAAFESYPVMRFVVGPPDEGYPRRLRHLIGYYADKRFQNRWPVVGIEHDRRLEAVALVSDPDRGPSVETAALETALERELGAEAFARLERFERASDRNEPDGPFHFVGMVGVMPAAQGLGYGRQLLDWARHRAVVAGSAGVSLSTENPANLPFYRHLGFAVVAQASLGDLDTWCLAWSNPAFHSA